MKTLSSVLLGLHVLFLVGCGASRAVRPPPPPPPVPLLAPVVETPLSSLRIPIQVDLDFLGQRILAAAPVPLVRDTIRKNVSLHLPAGLTSPAVGVAFRHETTLERIDLNLRGDSLTVVAQVGTKVSGAVEGGSLSWGVASCGDVAGKPTAGLEFTLRGRIFWGPDARILFVPRPWTIRWTRPCELTAFQIRLEDILDLPVVRRRLARTIDSAVETIPDRIQIRPLAEQAWSDLSRPRQIHPGMFLSVRPESLKVAPLRGSGKVLRTAVLLTARPRISSDSLDSSRALPYIRVDATPDRGFQLDLGASLPLALVDSTLTSLLASRTFQADGRNVRILGARLQGGGDRAVLAVRFAEPFEGEVFLRGSPVYDSTLDAIRFEGLDFDLASRDFLVRTAAFLLHGSIRESIAAASVIPLGTALEPLQDLSFEATEGIRLHVDVERLLPLGISIDEGMLRAWVRAQGRCVLAAGMESP